MLYNVTIGSLTEANILVTFRGIEVDSPETARLVALGMMGQPDLWALVSLCSMDEFKLGIPTG